MQCCLFYLYIGICDILVTGSVSMQLKVKHFSSHSSYILSTNSPLIPDPAIPHLTSRGPCPFLPFLCHLIPCCPHTCPSNHERDNLHYINTFSIQSYQSAALWAVNESHTDTWNTRQVDHQSTDRRIWQSDLHMSSQSFWTVFDVAEKPVYCVFTLAFLLFTYLQHTTSSCGQKRQWQPFMTSNSHSVRNMFCLVQILIVSSNWCIKKESWGCALAGTTREPVSCGLHQP